MRVVQDESFLLSLHGLTLTISTSFSQGFHLIIVHCLAIKLKHIERVFVLLLEDGPSEQAFLVHAVSLSPTTYHITKLDHIERALVLGLAEQALLTQLLITHLINQILDAIRQLADEILAFFHGF